MIKQNLDSGSQSSSLKLKTDFTLNEAEYNKINASLTAFKRQQNLLCKIIARRSLNLIKTTKCSFKLAIFNGF